MRALLRLALLLPALALAAVPVLLYLAIDGSPALTGGPEWSAADAERVERLLRAHDPRVRGPAERTLTLTADELGLLASHLAARVLGGTATVSLARDAVHARLTLPLAWGERYLNVAATLETPGGRPRLLDVRVGRLPVPDVLAGWLVAAGVARLAGLDAYRAGRSALREVRAGPDGLHVRYRWEPDLARLAHDHLLPPQDRTRLLHYHTRLVLALAREAHRPDGVPGAGLLARLAGASPTPGLPADAVAENRALLLVLALYVTGRDIRAALPQTAPVPRAPRRLITLAGRVDLAQHFFGSAAITAAAGSALAGALGVGKELADARSGGGFSFADLAADRAGTRLGEEATASLDRAGALRLRLARGVRDSDLLPPVDGLPEHMSRAELERRFGGVGSPAYQAVVEEVERRVARLALYRE